MTEEFNEENNVEKSKDENNVEDTQSNVVNDLPALDQDSNEPYEYSIPNNKKGWKKELLEWIESLAVAVVVALLIVNFVFTLVRVSGESMMPTLQDKNNLFVLRLAYKPHTGDIVVFKPVGDQKRYYIKRIIAVEGQTVDIKDGKVFVDEQELTEDYTQGVTFDRYNETYPKTVPEDHVFVMGDNRENSRDSRDPTGVGMVENKSIVGKALFRLFPFNEIGGLY